MEIEKTHIKPLLIVSIVGTLIPAIIFAKSQLYIQSYLAGMLNSLTPFFTFILGFLFINKVLLGQLRAHPPTITKFSGLY